MPGRSVIAAAVLTGALFLAGCGGSDDRPLLATGDATATVAASTESTPASGGATPTPEQPAPSADGPTRISASISGSCKLAEGGSEITVTYRVRIDGSGRLTRLRFLVNGVVSEESGGTNERTIERSATIKVPDGTSHAFQVLAESGNIRSSSSTTVRCAAPTPGQTL